MAHKIKVKAVPHINRDGSVGTKKEFVVHCNRRGNVCTHEKFSTRRAAEDYVAEHWHFVNRRKTRISTDLATKRQVERLPGVRMTIHVHPDAQNFQSPRVRRAQRQTKAGVRAA